MSAGTNWAGSHSYAAPSYVEPSSIEELQEIVASSERVRALGSRHSFNDLADSPGTLIGTARLPHVLEVLDEDTIAVAPWMKYGEIAAALRPHGLALHNLASLPHISVAGAIATGTHGSGDNNANLAGAVAGLTMIGASGELVTLQPVDPEFDGAVVSLGALGILTSVVLDVEPAFEVRQSLWEALSWTALLANLDTVTGAAYSVSVFTTWTGDIAGTVWLKQTVPGRVRGELFDATAATAELHPLPGADAAPTTEQLGVAGLWGDRLPHFRMEFTPSNGDEIQTEYLVPRARAVEAIEAMRALGSRIEPLLLVSEIRTTRADSLWLSGSYEADTVNLHFTWKKLPSEVAALLPFLEAALLPLGARPHWGKWFAAGHASLRPLYPRFEDFRALAAQYDPSGKFRNEYLARTLDL